jgi:hypothetical protein
MATPSLPWRCHGQDGSEIRTHMCPRRYNTAVPATSPQPEHQTPGRKHPIYTREAAGVLIIGVLILILTLVRYWHHIAWSAR